MPHQVVNEMSLLTIFNRLLKPKYSVERVNLGRTIQGEKMLYERRSCYYHVKEITM